MTPAESRLVGYLAARRGALVGVHELREAIGSAHEGSVKVLVHRLRAGGVAIGSVRGCHGGYRMDAA